VNLAVSGFHLTGRVDDVYPKGLIQHRYAALKPRDFLRAWIYHLVLNSLSAKGYPRTTRLAGLGKRRSAEQSGVAWHFAHVGRSEQILDNLLRRYWEGLKRPLPFFPETSWAYALERIEQKSPPEKALQKARSQWEGDQYNRGECKDPYYQQCFGQRDYLQEAFQVITEEIFTPMLAHMEKEKR
jgi:exodeoxyribonuclease V gamma subunit